MSWGQSTNVLRHEALHQDIAAWSVAPSNVAASIAVAAKVATFGKKCETFDLSVSPPRGGGHEVVNVGSEINRCEKGSSA